MSSLSFLLVHPAKHAGHKKRDKYVFVISRKHLQHNFKFELFFEIKLREHFRISKWIFLQAKFIGKSLASGPKVDFWYCN